MGKAIAFMIFVWMIVSIAGGVAEGSVTTSTTALTADISDVAVIITVANTDNFPDTGFVTVLDEKIGYASKTATTFRGNLAQPLIRGAQDTEAIAHVTGELVRSPESSMLNQSIGYKLAVLSDSSGMLAFVTIPFAFLSLLATFLILPLSFLGTDLQILTYIWGALSIAIIVAIGIALAGGRRMS